MPEYNHFISNTNDLKDFVIAVYVIIDDIYQRVTPANIRNRRNIGDSKMSDSEIITISIVGELLTIDSEKAWLGFCKRNLKDLFPTFCERSRFNRTRRNLQAVIEEIRKEICKVTDAVYQICQYQFVNLEGHGFIKPLEDMGPAMENVLLKKKRILDISFICWQPLMAL